MVMAESTMGAYFCDPLNSPDFIPEETYIKD